MSHLRKVRGALYRTGVAAPLEERFDQWRQRHDIARWQHEQADLVRALRDQLTPAPEVTVTVVVPTYRRPALLQRAVASVERQTFTDYRLVVVDDGGGVEMATGDRRTVLSLPSNTANLGLVRNVGILLSRSRYLAFLDDDNEWREEHLERHVEALESGADFSYSKAQVREPDGRVLHEVGRPFSRWRLAVPNYIDASTIMVRRSLEPQFSVMVRPKGSWRFEDWEFARRYARSGRTRYIPQATVNYLRNPQSYYIPWT